MRAVGARASAGAAGTLLLMVAASGCLQGPSELPRIHVEPERDAWQAGERVVIHARFHNTAGQSFSYTAGGRCEFYLRVWVANTTGEVTSHGLWPWPRHEPGSCAEVMTRVTIGPGQELVDTVSWDGSLEPRGGRPFVAPGDYVVHASFYPWSSAAFPWDASGQAVVRVLARLGDMPGS